jgi:hypothetical protein
MGVAYNLNKNLLAIVGQTSESDITIDTALMTSGADCSCRLVVEVVVEKPV